MKLWFQSGGALGVDPAWRDYEQSLSKHLRKVARPDTEIHLQGAKVFSPGIVSHRYDMYVHTAQIIDFAMQAEREGYDAFVQTCTVDPGFYELREAVEIPVIFPIETSLHIATMLAPKVAFLVMNPLFLSYLTERAKLYGFQEHLAPGGYGNLTPSDLQRAFKNPGPAIKELETVAKKIGEQGANILICAGNPITMLLVEQGMMEIGGVPVLDSLGVLVKVAELMVDLQKMGITRKNMGIYSPLPKEHIKSTRQMYGID